MKPQSPPPPVPSRKAPQEARRASIVGWLKLGALLASVVGLPQAAVPVLGSQSTSSHVIREGGRLTRYTIADNEWYVGRSGATPGYFERFADSNQREQRRAAQQTAVLPDRLFPVAYAGGRMQPENRRVVTADLVVRLGPRADVNRLRAAVPGLRILGPISWAPDFLHLRVSDPADTFPACAAIRNLPGVLAVHPQLGRDVEKDFIPDDPIFPEQWHLQAGPSNGGTEGVDIQVVPVWESYRGEGQVLGILDDAVQVDHPDLADGIDLSLAYDFRDDDVDPSPGNLAEDLHGTGVTGFAAARGNNGVGVTGVAYEARVAPLRLIGDAELTEEKIGNAFVWKNDVIQVKNNSWGSRTTDGLDYPGEVLEKAIDVARTEGRGGKGEILVFSAGNYGQLGDDVNYNMMKSRPDIIPVGSIIEDGSPASYTTPGAPLLVCAPGGEAGLLSMRTTDLMGGFGQNAGSTAGDLVDPDFTANFSGTSASAPIVTGVIALLLQANPSLGWRDVQEILIRSALKIKPSDGDWATNPAGFHFHPYHGAGLVQAKAAVDLASGWTLLGQQRSEVVLARDLDLAIPDNRFSSAKHSFVVSGPPIRVEHVRVTVDITHQRRGQLKIQLHSPGGMTSVLADQHSDRNDDYEYWTFGSRRHWGEVSTGTWTLEVTDMSVRQTGRINFARIELLGTRVGGVEFLGSTWREQEGKGDLDGVISPGETLQETVTVRNVSSQRFKGVAMEIANLGNPDDLVILNGHVDLNNLDPNATGINSLPLSYRVSSTTNLCGRTLELGFVSIADGVRVTNRVTRVVGIEVGGIQTNTMVASESLPLTVPDRGTALAPLLVDLGDARLEDVEVAFQLEHTTVGDTQVALVHPDGTEVALAINRGGNNPNMGTGACDSDQSARFSDAALVPVSEGLAPFEGVFRPDENLGVLRGKAASGLWRLRLSDVYDDDSGLLHCWSLTLKSHPQLARCAVYEAPPVLRILSERVDATGRFQLRGFSPVAGQVILESSSDLIGWSRVTDSVVAAGEFELVEPEPVGAQVRYFRLKQAP